MPAATEYAKSEHIGEVGDEFEAEGYVNWISDPVKNKYDGPRFRYLINVGGNTVTAFGYLPRVQKGDRIQFTGTVAEHKVYKDQNQTEVKKLKLVRVTAAAD